MQRLPKGSEPLKEGFIMKCVCALLVSFLLVGMSPLVRAQGTEAEQRASICDDLLQELLQPLPAPEVTESDAQHFLEPLFAMDQTKLGLLGMFGFSFTLMLRVLFQMHLKAQVRRNNTHASTLHYQSHKAIRWMRRRKDGVTLRHAIRRSMGRSFTTLEEFHINTLEEGHRIYSRSRRRFAHSVSY